MLVRERKGHRDNRFGEGGSPRPKGTKQRTKGQILADMEAVMHISRTRWPIQACVFVAISSVSEAIPARILVVQTD